MRLSLLCAFVTFALWVSACDSINEYSRRNNSLLRRGGVFHRVEQHAYNGFISWNNDGRYIYVITFSGRLWYTYNVKSDESEHEQVEHIPWDTRYIINSQNRDGEQETHVLLKPHGLYTYTVDPGAGYKVQKSHDPNANTLTYYDEVLAGKRIRREIGHSGEPVKVKDLESGEKFIFDPIQRQGHSMEAEQAMVGQSTSGYNAYISWSWVGLKHHIYVIGYNGEPVRTYIMDADERHYIVVNHSHQPTRYTVMSQVYGKRLVTKVLGPDHLHTYTVEPDGFERVESVVVTIMSYSHADRPDGKQYTRHVGPGGRPIRTLIKHGNYDLDQTVVFPTLRPITEADHIVQ